jgi:hypothetical protein
MKDDESEPVQDTAAPKDFDGAEDQASVSG